MFLGEQGGEQFLVLGAEVGDEPGQHAGPVLAAPQQLKHAVRGHRGLRGSGAAGQLVGEPARGRQPAHGALGVQPGQRGHDRGVRELIAQLGAYLAGCQGAARGREAGQDLLLEDAAAPAG